MRVYLAANYSRRAEMEGYASLLRADGHTVNVRWITGAHEGLPETEIAINDYEDCTSANVHIQFVPGPGQSKRNRGGRHVEFGLALATDQMIFLVGPKENVFHSYPTVIHVDDFEEARTYLRRYPRGDSRAAP